MSIIIQKQKSIVLKQDNRGAGGVHDHQLLSPEMREIK
jgi:hypothetical protein